MPATGSAGRRRFGAAGDAIELDTTALDADAAFAKAADLIARKLKG